MARIRSIKPEAFTSETLSSLDYFTRWTFAGLWTYFDDHGYGRADARLIRAALFPLDDDATVAKVQKAVQSLESAGCLCRFSVNDREYLHAVKWSTHQKVNRPTESKIPPCPEHESGEIGTVLSPHGALSEDSVSAHGGLTVGTGNREQGTGNARERSSTDVDGEFEALWQAYPKKVGKGQAVKAFRAARKKADFDTISAGLAAAVAGWRSAGTDPQFIPNPTTWLNGERWADQPTRPAGGPSGPVWEHRPPKDWDAERARIAAEKAAAKAAES